MLVICNGMPRSASTWSFNVVMQLLTHEMAGGEPRGAYSETPDAWLASNYSGQRDCVLKTHALTPAIENLAREGGARLLYTIRNVADAAESFMAVFRVDFDHALAVMDTALADLARHRAGGGTLIIDYAGVLADRGRVVRDIAAYLRLAVAEERIGAVAEATSLPRMRAQVPRRHDAARAAALAPQARTGGYDPRTLLNIGHIRDGRSGGGSRNLSAAQLSRIAALLDQYGLDDTLQPVARSAECSY